MNTLLKSSTNSDNNINILTSAIIQTKMEKRLEEINKNKEDNLEPIVKKEINISSIKNDIIKHYQINKYK
jgi:hypothetical protein